MTLRADVTFKVIRFNDGGAIALRAYAIAAIRVDCKVCTASKTKKWSIIANAHCEAFMIRMIRVLLFPVFVKVVRIAVRPGFYRVCTKRTDKSFALRHVLYLQSSIVPKRFPQLSRVSQFSSTTCSRGFLHVQFDKNVRKCLERSIRHLIP